MPTVVRIVQSFKINNRVRTTSCLKVLEDLSQTGNKIKPYNEGPGATGMVQISQILIEPGHSVLKHEVFIKIHLDLASVLA